MCNRFLRFMAILAGFLVVTAATVSASGVSGPIIWSDDVAGETNTTGFVFASNCNSSRTPDATEEAATLALLDDWSAEAVADGFTYLVPAVTPADDASGDNATITFPGAGSLTASVSRRQVPPANAIDPNNGSTGTFSTNAVFSDSDRMQDCAPRPADLSTAPAGTTLASSMQYGVSRPDALPFGTQPRSPRATSSMQRSSSSLSRSARSAFG